MLSGAMGSPAEIVVSGAYAPVSSYPSAGVSVKLAGIWFEELQTTMPSLSPFTNDLARAFPSSKLIVKSLSSI